MRLNYYLESSNNNIIQIMSKPKLYKKKAKVTSKGIQVITIEGQLISSMRCYYSLGKKNKDVL